MPIDAEYKAFVQTARKLAQDEFSQLHETTAREVRYQEHIANLLVMYRICNTCGRVVGRMITIKKGW